MPRTRMSCDTKTTRCACSPHPVSFLPLRRRALASPRAMLSRGVSTRAAGVTCTTATSPRGPYSLTKEARRFAGLGQLRVQAGRRLVALKSFGEFAHLLIYDAQVKMSVRVIRIERDGAREMVCARDAKECAPSDSLLAKRVHHASTRRTCCTIDVLACVVSTSKIVP